MRGGLLRSIYDSFVKYEDQCHTMKQLRQHNILGPEAYSFVDHIAYRGFMNLTERHKRIMDSKLYKHMGDIDFPEQGVTAKWYLSLNAIAPARIFASEIDPKRPRQDDTYFKWIRRKEPDDFNHVAFLVPDLEKIVEQCQKYDIELNDIDGIIKTSKDGKLHQASTTSTGDSPFVEFVQRDMMPDKTMREGFEKENAAPIFRSTLSTISIKKID